MPKRTNRWSPRLRSLNKPGTSRRAAKHSQTLSQAPRIDGQDGIWQHQGTMGQNAVAVKRMRAELDRLNALPIERPDGRYNRPWNEKTISSLRNAARWERYGRGALQLTVEGFLVFGLLSLFAMYAVAK